MPKLTQHMPIKRDLYVKQLYIKIYCLSISFELPIMFFSILYWQVQFVLRTANLIIFYILFLALTFYHHGRKCNCAKMSPRIKQQTSKWYHRIQSLPHQCYRKDDGINFFVIYNLFCDSCTQTKTSTSLSLFDTFFFIGISLY